MGFIDIKAVNTEISRIVEFETEEDVKAAVRKLDGVDFKGSEVILHEDLVLMTKMAKKVFTVY